VCLDTVDGLGAFVELEAVISAGDAGCAAQQHLDGLVQQLGATVRRTTDTDAAENSPDIDAGRTAATGDSFGGHMANWAADTDRDLRRKHRTAPWCRR
jgi:hypothetical protein